MEKGMIEEKKVERVVREGRPQQLPMMKEIVFSCCGGLEDGSTGWEKVLVVGQRRFGCCGETLRDLFRRAKHRSASGTEKV
jgi:hypothetical protein